MRRGLSVNEVDEVLDPLTKRAMIQAATNLVIVAKDEAARQCSNFNAWIHRQRRR
jgi:hypothetical protein